MGNMYRLPAPVSGEFWKVPQISERQFIDKADTFDILLFTCNNPVAGVIRSYSKSEYDHLAMVIRYSDEPDEVYFIEAVGVHGIMIK